MIAHLLVLLGCSLPGLLTWRWLWCIDMEHRYERIRAPRVADVPVTLDSDYRGLVL